MRLSVPATAYAALLLCCVQGRSTAQSMPAPRCHAPENGSALAGVVRDSTSALIPGARVDLDESGSTQSGDDGRFRFACISPGRHTLVVQADGFAPVILHLQLPHAGDLQVLLQLATVQIGVQVNGDTEATPNPNAAGAAETISGKQLQSLADDPDDLQRELEQLGAAGGGNPANTTIAVDGFQDTSKLPPKSSIAYIKINPDQFSAEYREPPFEGGRVEVYTKPGQSAFHGALFATNSSSWMNAQDPFSTSRGPLGKQRYGFELTGPLRRGADFALDLEHRSINNVGVVDAFTLLPNGSGVSTLATVPTPQRLWVGQARVDWQLGTKNTLIASYAPNFNHLSNVGVGGTTLPEAGYDSGQSEQVLRFTLVTTISAHVMHEAHASLSWDDETDVPASAAPQLQVAGAFTGGGSSIGAQRARYLRTEIDDDAIISGPKNTLKFGTELFTNHHHDLQTLDFNGAYQFGGGVAPVLTASGAADGTATETISGLEQYRRALLGLPGGIPTAFTQVAGSPALSFTQIRDALYVQDDWNCGKGVHLSSGLRYFLQDDPVTVNGITPRIGLLWSPGKKGTWTLHAHAGLFATQFQGRDWAELRREDGLVRQTLTIYNPVYCGAEAVSTCNTLNGASVIRSERTLASHLGGGSYAIENVGGTRSLPFGWNLSFDLFDGRLWNIPRTLNTNTPFNDDPTGLRPSTPNLNILEVQNSGQGRAKAAFAGVEQHSLKRVELFFGGTWISVVDDTDDDIFFQPQSAYTDAGEFAHRTNQPIWNLFGNATFTLPWKLSLSGTFNGAGDAHYNLTTGFDNNWDGDFNDRPQFASPGTTGAVPTRYGLLVASGGTGVLGRNLGVMPWTFHLDTNLQRAFVLTRNTKAEHQQTLSANLRSANVLNHTNVTAVGGVLGSPFFGVPYQADNGRRVEAGLRYSF